MFKLRSLISYLAVLAVASPLVLAQDYTCSKTQQCQNGGCCRLEPNSDKGNCGLGPTFCGPGNCTSTCDAKAECNPGWPSNYSLATACPLNTCCGQYGFCGTTPDYCGVNATAIPQPSCSTNTTSKRVVAYFEGWNAKYLCNQMPAANIPQGYFTHLNLAFLVIDPTTFEVAGMDNYTQAQYGDLATLKKNQPGLQTWISVGGYAFNDPGPTNTTFSSLVASTANQTVFFKSLISFMNQFGIDGVDIDWEYPGSAEREGKPEDVKSYVTFLQNLRTALDAAGNTTRLGLSITTPASYYYLKTFDLVNIAPMVDWFNVMTYDYHGVWDASMTVAAHTNLSEISDTMDLFWRNSIDPEKVTLGLGFYGRSFTLASNATTCPEGICPPGTPFVSGGVPGKCTNISGILSATEIKDMLTTKNASVALDTDAAVMIAQWDKDQWMSYDDTNSFELKLKYANSRCLGGLMIWSIDFDADAAMQEALAYAGNLPRQYSINGTLSFINSTTFSNASATSPPFRNVTAPKTAALNSTTSATASACISATASASASEADACDDKASTSGATTAATSAAAISAPATSAIVNATVAVDASTTAAPAATGTGSSSGSAPNSVQDGVDSSCTAWYLVQKGDGCANLATVLKIQLSDFYKWNPAVKSDCLGLLSGVYVCVGVSPTAATTITSDLAGPVSSAAAAATSS